MQNENEFVEVQGCSIKVDTDSNGLYSVFGPSGFKKVRWAWLSNEAQDAIRDARERREAGTV